MAEQKVGPWARASGLALGVVVLAQLAIGFYLNSGYTPTTEAAHDTVRAYREADWPRFLQNAHYWGSAWLILHGFAHIFLMMMSGAYLRVSRWAWLGSVGLFGTSFLMQVTGNLLPFDRHDVQTAVIEGNIAASLPLLGEFSKTLLMNGREFGPGTLAAWHTIHLALIAPLTVCGLICLFGFAAAGKPQPIHRFFWLIPLAAIAAASLGLPAPYGSAATVVDYTADRASPSWYTWPMHGALNTFDSLSPGLGWIGTAVLPGLLAAVMLAAPWIGAKRDRLMRGIFFAVVGGFFASWVLNPGTPAAPFGFQEPTPEEEAPVGEVAPIDDSLAERGFDLAKSNCAGCHGAELKGGGGFPDLTVQYKRHSDSEYFRRFIKNPKGAKPGSRMPGFSHLSDDKIAAMAEWLRKPKP